MQKVARILKSKEDEINWVGIRDNLVARAAHSKVRKRLIKQKPASSVAHAALIAAARAADPRGHHTQHAALHWKKRSLRGHAPLSWQFHRDAAPDQWARATGTAPLPAAAPWPLVARTSCGAPLPVPCMQDVLGSITEAIAKPLAAPLLCVRLARGRLAPPSLCGSHSPVVDHPQATLLVPRHHADANAADLWRLRGRMAPVRLRHYL